MTTSQRGYHGDLFGAARVSDDFRRVLSTTAHTQLVIMTIPPGGEIGAEVHDGIDQTLVVVEGDGESVVDGVKGALAAGYAVVVPEGAEHNIRNTGDAPLRLVTVYGPPDHRPGTVHRTKQEADRDEGDVPPGG